MAESKRYDMRSHSNRFHRPSFPHWQTWSQCITISTHCRNARQIDAHM